MPTEFDGARFESVLLELSGDPSKWSLRKEWILFHKTYVITSSSKLKHARSYYDFHRRHLVKENPSVVEIFPTDDHGTSMMDDVTGVNLTDDLFPGNHIGENDKCYKC